MSYPNVSKLRNPAAAGFFVYSGLLLAILYLAPAMVIASEPYLALYKLQADGLTIGRLERSLEQAADGSFVLKSKTYTTGLWAIFVKDRVSEESSFRIDGARVTPQSYHYQKLKKGKLFEERVTFDMGQQIISASTNDGQQQFPLNGNESDKLLYQYRIRAALRDGQSDLHYQVVDRIQLRPYQFRVAGLEKLDTEMGIIEALRVERINEENRQTTLWFAPELDYLPVKIMQDAGDHNFSSTIISTSLKR